MVSYHFLILINIKLHIIFGKLIFNYLLKYGKLVLIYLFYMNLPNIYITLYLVSSYLIMVLWYV